jgi:hypothetical protein
MWQSASVGNHFLFSLQIQYISFPEDVASNGVSDGDSGDW